VGGAVGAVPVQGPIGVDGQPPSVVVDRVVMTKTDRRLSHEPSLAGGIEG
jgi:hypothetical protein